MASSSSHAPSYAAVLREPHVLRTFAPALVARFSYGIVFVSLAVALTQATGSYAWAGGALALFGASTAFLAPLRARLIDRRGPRRVLPTMAAVYALLLAALTAATWQAGAPRWLLMLLTGVAGACAPPLGPVMRAAWSALLPDPAQRQRAFSLDTVAEELLYVSGPLAAGVFIAVGHPAIGVGVSAGLLLSGTLVMVASPAMCAPDPGIAAGARQMGVSRGRWRGLRGNSLLEPVMVTAGVGMCLGALSLLLVVFSERQKEPAAVAWLEAALAVGSAIGGLAYGARAWRLPGRIRLPLLALALGLVLSIAGMSPNLWVLALVVCAAGACVAPALTTAYLVADECTDTTSRTRAGTWVNSAFNAGSSGGTALTGLTVDLLPLWCCFAVATLPAVLSGVAVLARVPLPRPRLAGRREPGVLRDEVEGESGAPQGAPTQLPQKPGTASGSGSSLIS
ncbi:MFS transporter [Streptomyces decoyicus]